MNYAKRRLLDGYQEARLVCMKPFIGSIMLLSEQITVRLGIELKMCAKVGKSLTQAPLESSGF